MLPVVQCDLKDNALHWKCRNCQGLWKYPQTSRMLELEVTLSGHYFYVLFLRPKKKGGMQLCFLSVYLWWEVFTL